MEAQNLANWVQTRNARHAASLDLCSWDKLRYTTWVELVKEQFKEGDMVTYAPIQPKAGAIPLVMYVSYIHEVVHQVKMDHVLQQPKAIVTKTIRDHDKVVNFSDLAPSQLRHLTTEEKDLVVLKDTKPVGFA